MEAECMTSVPLDSLQAMDLESDKEGDEGDEKDKAIASKSKESLEVDEDDDDEDSPPPLLGDNDDDDSSVGIGEDIPTAEETEELLIQASSLKEQGNAFFKESSLDLAARSYRKGVNLLKNVVSVRSDEVQITSVFLALQTNLAMVLFKQKKFKMSFEVASKALLLQPTNVKALYRRAVARRAMGDLDEARKDLKLAIETDPNNSACRKELVAVKKDLEQSKENQKKALAKAFAKDSSGLYNDKAEIERKRKQQEHQRKLLEQEQYKKRKQQWEDECVKRMANDQPAISFEEWETEQAEAKKKEEEIKRKTSEAKKKEREEKRKKELVKAKPSDSDQEDSEDEGFTASELATMRGYKITKDGRKTSYFTRELSEQEKQVYDIAPKRLDSTTSDGGTSSANTSAATPSSNNNNNSNTLQPSAWNQAGTWEEKDTTTWCTAQLRNRLQETCVSLSPDHVVSIHELKDLSGHASVAHAAGKKRYIFEFHADMVYEIKNELDDVVVARGKVKLPDIESTSHDELEVTFDSGWKKRPSGELEDMARSARTILAEELRAQVRRWVEDFNGNY